MKKFKKIFLTDFPSKQQGVFFFFFFFNFKLIFFFRFPLVVDGLGSVHQRTKKKYQNRVPPLWPYRHPEKPKFF